ncbi:MAG: hypothetical protein QXJ74_00890 [Nitrososphaera sp.]
MPTSHYKPELFLELAEKIIDDKDYDEKSKSRVAVGRAYYATYHKASKKLTELGRPIVGNERVHQQAIDRLREIKPDLSDQFSTLFGKRIEADYYLDVDVRKDLARTSIRLAHIVIREIGNLKND